MRVPATIGTRWALVPGNDYVPLPVDTDEDGYVEEWTRADGSVIQYSYTETSIIMQTPGGGMITIDEDEDE